jgi:hypothetical protein
MASIKREESGTEWKARQRQSRKFDEHSQTLFLFVIGTPIAYFPLFFLLLVVLWIGKQNSKTSARR